MGDRGGVQISAPGPTVSPFCALTSTGLQPRQRESARRNCLINTPQLPMGYRAPLCVCRSCQRWWQAGVAVGVAVAEAEAEAEAVAMRVAVTVAAATAMAAMGTMSAVVGDRGDRGSDSQAGNFVNRFGHLNRCAAVAVYL